MWSCLDQAVPAQDVISGELAPTSSGSESTSGEETEAESGQLSADEQPSSDVIDPLAELRWMEGEWVDQGQTSRITCTCSAFGRGGFLRREFRITFEGEDPMLVTQMIGVDPLSGQIQSWTFDSVGGHGTGTWKLEGATWVVKKSFVLPDGQTASATNLITKLSDDAFRWKSVYRQIGSELQPNTDEFTIVRRSPPADLEGPEADSPEQGTGVQP